MSDYMDNLPELKVISNERFRQEHRETHAEAVRRNSEPQTIRVEDTTYEVTIPSGISPLHDRTYSFPVQNGVIMNPYLPRLGLPNAQ